MYGRIKQQCSHELIPVRNAATRRRCTCTRRLRGVGMQMIEHFSLILAFLNLSSLALRLSRCILLTVSKRTLMIKCCKMSIRCQYMLPLHSSSSYFQLSLCPRHYSGIHLCSQLERLKSRNLISVAQ